MKLVLTWSAPGAEPQSWDIDPDALTVGEIKALEKASGYTLGTLGDMVNHGSFTAILGFLWVFRRRDEPGLAYDAMDDVPARELELERSDDEVDAEGKEPSDPPALDEVETPSTTES